MLPLRISGAALWPATGAVVSDAAILIDGAGRIAEVGPAATVPAPDGVQQVTYPDAILIPGLVNAHTHLELHGLRGQVPEAEFFAWLQHVRREKEVMPPGAFGEAARDGLRETWACGTTAIADTGTSGATVAALRELGGRGVYYHEVIAPDSADRTEALDRFRDEVQRLSDLAAGGVRIGVSPHAPYTVSPALVRDASAFARSERLPLAAHLAESQAEVDFVVSHRGAFADLWSSRKIPLPEPARTPVAYADRLGLLGPNFLAIHAVHADEADIETLARREVAVAVCLRSNRRHGHGEPPLGAFLAAGLAVGLGTDSAASVDSLDLFAEARAARALVGLTADVALRLLTIDAARAIGMDLEIGSLDPGKWADVCVVRLPESRRDGSMLEAIIEQGISEVVATYVGGRAVYRSERA